MEEPFFWEEFMTHFPLYKRWISDYYRIKEELDDFLGMPGSLISFPRYDTSYKEELDSTPLYENTWLVMPFSKLSNEALRPDPSKTLGDLSNGYMAGIVKQLCPTLAKSIAEYESRSLVTNCFISKLLPGSIIHPHRGRTNKFMRMQMGISCDKKCLITVGSEHRTWRAGEIIAFKDGGPYLHSVKHSGSECRIIISCDVDLNYLSLFSDRPI